MEKFRYVGKSQSNGRLSVLHAVPISLEVKQQNQINTFSKVFRDQVTSTLCSQGSWAQPSIYADLQPQHGAFDRLMEIVKHHGYDVVSVTRNSVDRGEFVCCVQVRIPVKAAVNDLLFDEGVPPGRSGYVLVNFDVGVCREFTRLMKKNELVDAALDILQKFNACDLAKVEVPASEIARATAQDKGDSFDPEIAILDTLNYMRAELRYTILHGIENYGSSRFYQTPEGYIYRVEVDGYITAAVE